MKKKLMILLGIITVFAIYICTDMIVDIKSEDHI